MPQGIQYDVSAVLRTHGSFRKEMRGAAASADRFGRSFGSMADRLVVAGERVRGTFGNLAATFAGGALRTGAAALVAGVGAAAAEGIKFNNQMEQGALGLATMYSTFGVASKSMKVMTGEMTEFAKSVELAESMQQELFDIAKASPATFGDIKNAYEQMAPGVTGVTKDLQRQKELMEKVAVLGFTTGGDYQQLGADIGRIAQGLAGQDVRAFATLRPALEKAFEEVSGKKAAADFAQQFNKEAGEIRLATLEKAISKIPKEANKAFEQSFAGMSATIGSELQIAAGEFGRPLMESMKKAMRRVTGEPETFAGLQEVAAFAGQQLARAADHLFMKIEKGVKFVTKNYEMIARKIQEGGVLAGAALKAAAVVATTRMVAGMGMIAAGKTIKGVRRAREGIGAMRERGRGMFMREHLRQGRRLRDRGPTRAQKGLGVLGAAMGKAGPGLDRFVLRIGTFTKLIATAGIAVAGLGLAFAGVGVIVGGLAAYIISNWEKIRDQLVKGLQDGTITLVPLITAMYTFYERLRLAGEALFGTIDATSVATGGLELMTGAVNFASTVIGGMIKAVAIMVEVWGALRLAFSAFMKVIAQMLKMMSKIPRAGKGLKQAASNAEKFANQQASSSFDSLARAEELKRAAEAISAAELDPMKLEKAKKKAASLEKSLQDMLSGKGADGKGRSRKPGVNINKVEVIVDMRDPDPDRVLAAFIPKFMQMADKRVQPYDALEQGT